MLQTVPWEKLGDLLYFWTNHNQSYILAKYVFFIIFNWYSKNSNVLQQSGNVIKSLWYYSPCASNLVSIVSLRHDSKFLLTSLFQHGSTWVLTMSDTLYFECFCWNRYGQYTTWLFKTNRLKKNEGFQHNFFIIFQKVKLKMLQRKVSPVYGFSVIYMISIIGPASGTLYC